MLDEKIKNVTILILIDGFLQSDYQVGADEDSAVTILILIDGFLQCSNCSQCKNKDNSHNPYFNRWFSAISTPCFFW